MVDCEYKTLSAEEPKEVKLSLKCQTFTSKKTFLDAIITFKEKSLKVVEGRNSYEILLGNILEVSNAKKYPFFQSEEFKDIPDDLLFSILYFKNKIGEEKTALCVKTSNAIDRDKFVISLKITLESKFHTSSSEPKLESFTPMIYRGYTASKGFKNTALIFEEKGLKIFEGNNTFFISFTNIVGIYCGKSYPYFQSEEFKNIPSDLLFSIEYFREQEFRMLCIETPNRDETTSFLRTLKRNIQKCKPVRHILEDKECSLEIPDPDETLKTWCTQVSRLADMQIDSEMRKDFVKRLKSSMLPELKKLVELIESLKD